MARKRVEKMREEELNLLGIGVSLLLTKTLNYQQKFNEKNQKMVSTILNDEKINKKLIQSNFNFKSLNEIIQNLRSEIFLTDPLSNLNLIKEETKFSQKFTKRY